MAFPIDRIRKDFPILNQEGENRLIYLDNAATAQKPEAVLKALDGYYRRSNANVYRAIHRWGEESTRLYESARSRTARFINAREPAEIIFTSGATEGINLAASVLCRGFSEGDEILLTHMEHHSNIVPWQLAAEQYGLRLRYIPLTPAGELDRSALAALWSPRTRLLALTHMSNVLGTVNPLRELSAEAHRRNVLVLADGAQSVPHIPVDVQELDCDFLAFSGHKMYAPTGIGVLYGKRALLENLPPWQGGGEMIRSVYPDRSEWNELPHKFEAGTPPIAQAVALEAAIDYLENIGMEQIRRREEELTALLLEGLRAIPGVTLYGAAPRRGGIAAFSKQGCHAHDLTQYMDSRGIALRAGHHCAHILARELGALSTVRASLSFYNSEEDVRTFLRTLAEAESGLI